MPEFSRTAKRRHTFAFVSTRLPLFLHSLRYNNGGEPVRPSFFPFFFLFFFSFLVDAHTSRTRQRHGPWLALDQMKTRFSARYWLCGWNLSTDRCARHAGPRSITTPALSSLFSRPWVLTRRTDARKYGMEFFSDLQKDFECLFMLIYKHVWLILERELIWDSISNLGRDFWLVGILFEIFKFGDFHIHWKNS